MVAARKRTDERGDAEPLKPASGRSPAAVLPELRTDEDAERAAETDAEAPDDRPERLAARLGLRFRNPDLLRLALTHRSVLHVWAPPGTLPPPALRTNERLEFLGDAVLGAIAAEFLYARYPEADEGTLTARRVALVRAETLVRWARQIDLGDYLYLGTGERVTGSARDRMLAGAFEALVGAIALDQGQRAARRFLRPFLTREAARATAVGVANPKGRLQELLQERYRLAPTYRTLAAEGPAHARSFTVEVTLNGRPLGIGVGGSKREAQQAAAEAALALLAEGADPLAADAPVAGPALAHADRPGEVIVPEEDDASVADGAAAAGSEGAGDGNDADVGRGAEARAATAGGAVAAKAGPRRPRTGPVGSG